MSKDPGANEQQEDEDGDAWDNSIALRSSSSINPGRYAQSRLYEILTLEQIEELMQKMVAEIQDFFNMSEDMAITLLKYYNWNMDKLKIDYANDYTFVLAKHGLISDDTIQAEPNKGMCLICLNSRGDKETGKKAICMALLGHGLFVGLNKVVLH